MQKRGKIESFRSLKHPKNHNRPCINQATAPPKCPFPPPFSKIFLNFLEAGTQLHFYKKCASVAWHSQSPRVTTFLRLLFVCTSASALTFLIGGRCLRRRRMMGRECEKSSPQAIPISLSSECFSAHFQSAYTRLQILDSLPDWRNGWRGNRMFPDRPSSWHRLAVLFLRNVVSRRFRWQRHRFRLIASN